VPLQVGEGAGRGGVLPRLMGRGRLRSEGVDLEGLIRGLKLSEEEQ